MVDSQDKAEVGRVGVGGTKGWDSGHSGPVPPLLADATGRGSKERAQLTGGPNSDRVKPCLHHFFFSTYHRNLSKIAILYIFIYYIYKSGK